MIKHDHDYVTAILKRDLWSKLTDGILTAVILCLTWLMITIVSGPIEMLFGTPGLLVYILGLLAASMIMLQQSLDNRHADATRAWYGIAGGFLSWAVTEVSARIGVPVSNPSGIVLLIMVSLILTLLWRSGLQLGARFFGLTFVLNWAGHMLMDLQGWLAQLSPVFLLTYRATGYAAIGATVLLISWLLFQSSRRIQRIHLALGVWFLISLALYVFRGSLF